jgi:hypothetical protein
VREEDIFDTPKGAGELPRRTRKASNLPFGVRGSEMR